MQDCNDELTRAARMGFNSGLFLDYEMYSIVASVFMLLMLCCCSIVFICNFFCFPYINAAPKTIDCVNASEVRTPEEI